MSLIEKLFGRVEKDKAAALKLYRSAVAAAAAGTDLGEKQVGEVADALTTLGVTREAFDKDVNAFRLHRDLKARVDGHPSLAERDKQLAALNRAVEAAKSEVEAAQVKLRQLQFKLTHFGGDWLSWENQLADAIRANPRLFS